jgi:hypothetical protein
VSEAEADAIPVPKGPYRVARRSKAGQRHMEATHQTPDGDKDISRVGPRRVARQIGHHLPTLIVDTQTSRRTVEPDLL